MKISAYFKYYCLTHCKHSSYISEIYCCNEHKKAHFFKKTIGENQFSTLFAFDQEKSVFQFFSAGGGEVAGGAVGMDDAMAGDNKGDGIFCKCVADCPAGAGFANHSG